jgi:hypothetical protein
MRFPDSKVLNSELDSEVSELEDKSEGHISIRSSELSLSESKSSLSSPNHVKKLAKTFLGKQNE